MIYDNIMFYFWGGIRGKIKVLRFGCVDERKKIFFVILMWFIGSIFFKFNI